MGRTLVHRTMAVLAAMALALAGTVLMLPSPASADATRIKCKEPADHKRFILPGKPDVDVYVSMCVERRHDYLFTSAEIYWKPASSTDHTGGKRFDGIDVGVRLERYNTHLDLDTCNFTRQINSELRGSFNCEGPSRHMTVRGGFTADGYVDYDINDDGRGPRRWDVTGSPQID